MADKKSDKKKRAEEDARRRDRDDWFARQLGDEWVTVEPGIYRQAMWRPLADGAEPEPELAEPLDETLLEAIPAEEERPTSPDEWREVEKEKTSRGWWRSR